MSSIQSLLAFALLFGATSLNSVQAAPAFQTHQKVLNQVLEAVQAQVLAHQIPVVLFDVDDTLFDSRTRTLPILLRFAADPEMQHRYPAETSTLSRLQLWNIHYDLAVTLHEQGIDSPDFTQQISDFWVQHFFSNECENDRVIPSAPEYARVLARAGARVVYLTGRDQIRMGAGTHQAFQKKGFPVAGLSVLLMKPDAKLPDLEFKQSAFKWIGTQGKVVAVFENEPANLNAMKKAFPEAQAVFLDTIRSANPEVPLPGTVWIKTFQ